MKHVMIFDNGWYALFIRNQTQKDGQPMIGLWYILVTHNTKIIDILPTLEYTYTALILLRGIATYAINPLLLSIKHTRDVQKFLTFKLCIKLFAQKEM